MSGRKIVRYIDTGRKTRQCETPFSTGKKVTKKHFDKDDVHKKSGTLITPYNVTLPLNTYKYISLLLIQYS